MPQKYLIVTEFRLARPNPPPAPNKEHSLNKGQRHWNQSVLYCNYLFTLMQYCHEIEYMYLMIIRVESRIAQSSCTF